MKQNFGKKPWIYPQPVLMIATYGEDGTPDIMNAAWGGVGDDTQIFLCLSSNHKTVENILKRKAFTVSMATEEFMAQCDYLGMVSGNNVPDKVSVSGLQVSRSEFVDAPVIEDLPVCLHCELISYEPEHCHLFGEIVNTSADESVLTEEKPDIEKIMPLIFDISGSRYYSVGECKGKAFSEGKKYI